ncbi:hypothetical protein [Burkholderia ubonensis]|uniref:hypothetical protein n=1 Tax=Burkholderia ubonensis TaxID=101571 RepID=UPI000A6761B8|nr:hypothetical protein [Burkholderia ubonensis]
MQSIESIGAIENSVVKRGPVIPPQAVDGKFDISPTNTGRPLDVMSGLRNVEHNIVINQYGILNTLNEIKRTGGSISSLMILQLRVSEYTIKHQALSGAVSSMNQSLRTVLNAT